MHICSPPRAPGSISNGESPPTTHPRASSNWLQPILAPTTPRTTSCEARTPQVAKMAPGAPLHSASGGAEEASLTWPNGPRGRSGVACCDAKGCSSSSSATQRRHAGSNCHPPVFFWNIPKGVKLREYSENTHFTGGAHRYFLFHYCVCLFVA